MSTFNSQPTTIQVVVRCGRLPLGLAIAGSMPIVKGKGLIAGAWAKLVKELENVAKTMRARGEQSTSLKLVLETSFDALSARKQEEFLKMAVMAAGAVAPIEMLLNLWEIQVVAMSRNRFADHVTVGCASKFAEHVPGWAKASLHVCCYI